MIPQQSSPSETQRGEGKEKAWSEPKYAFEVDMPYYYMLPAHYRTRIIAHLHLIFLNLRRIRITGTARAKCGDHQCDPLPLLSLPASRHRLLQTIYRPVLHIFRLVPQHLLPYFRGTHTATTSPPPTPTLQGSWDDRNTYDLECVETWKRFACDDQL